MAGSSSLTFGVDFATIYTSVIGGKLANMNNFVGALVALFLSATTALQPGLTQLEAPEEPPSPEQVALAEFLASKKSDMPAEVLIKYPNWQAIVAISAAESGYCKHQAGTYNCLGIKDFRKGSPDFGGYRNFESWEEAIGYASELLYKYDNHDGIPEPKLMVVRWKGDYNTTHWLNNVSYSLSDIDKNIIQIATVATK